LYVVVNAACFDKDWKHFKYRCFLLPPALDFCFSLTPFILREQEKIFKAKGKDINVEVWANRSLIALQGSIFSPDIYRFKNYISSFMLFRL